jgi:glucan phosphorylase
MNRGGAGLEGDLWLNTPFPPSAASCTGGMKAALNGVVNVSG